MERYAAALEDGVLSVESGGDRLVVGEMDEVVDHLGGETYEINYDSDHSQVVNWLDLEEDGTLSFEVRETIAGMDFPEAFVSELAAREGGERTRFFAESMRKAWDAKGNMDDEENPFS